MHLSYVLYFEGHLKSDLADYWLSYILKLCHKSVFFSFLWRIDCFACLTTLIVLHAARRQVATCILSAQNSICDMVFMFALIRSFSIDYCTRLSANVSSKLWLVYFDLCLLGVSIQELPYCSKHWVLFSCCSTLIVCPFF